MILKQKELSPHWPLASSIALLHLSFSWEITARAVCSHLNLLSSARNCLDSPMLLMETVDAQFSFDHNILGKVITVILKPLQLNGKAKLN